MNLKAVIYYYIKINDSEKESIYYHTMYTYVFQMLSAHKTNSYVFIVYSNQ